MSQFKGLVVNIKSKSEWDIVNSIFNINWRDDIITYEYASKDFKEDLCIRIIVGDDVTAKRANITFYREAGFHIFSVEDICAFHVQKIKIL